MSFHQVDENGQKNVFPPDLLDFHEENYLIKRESAFLILIVAVGIFR